MAAVPQFELTGRYNGADRIYDERRAERAPVEPEQFDLQKDRVAAELMELAEIFAPGHKNRRILERAVAVLCGRNRLHIPKHVRDEVNERQGRQCAYCGASDAELHYDHIFPVILGGSNDASNLALACDKCNLSKGSKTLAEWRC